MGKCIECMRVVPKGRKRRQRQGKVEQTRQGGEGRGRAKLGSACFAYDAVHQLTARWENWYVAHGTHRARTIPTAVGKIIAQDTEVQRPREKFFFCMSSPLFHREMCTEVLDRME